MAADFGKNLKELRRRAGFSQEALAREIDVPLISFCRWEQGKQTPRVEYLDKLASALGVSTDELINGSPKQELKINIVWEVSDEMENLAMRSNEFNVGIRGGDFLIWGALPQTMTPAEIADRVKLELEAMAAAAAARNKVLNKKEG